MSPKSFAHVLLSLAVVVCAPQIALALEPKPAVPRPEEFLFPPPHQFLKNIRPMRIEWTTRPDGGMMGTPSPPESDSPDINAALEKMKHRRWQEAVGLLDRAIAANPSDTDGYFNRAIALWNLDATNSPQVLADLDRAIALAPDNYYALYTRGYLKHSLGDFQGALEDYNRSLALRARDIYVPYSLFARGAAKAAIGDWKGAVADYSDYAEIGPPAPHKLPQPDAYLWRGYAFKAAGDEKRAKQDFETVINIISSRSEPYTNGYVLRGQARAGLGDTQGALADLKKAAEQFTAFEAGRKKAVTERIRQLEGGL